MSIVHNLAVRHRSWYRSIEMRIKLVAYRSIVQRLRSLVSINATPFTTLQTHITVNRWLAIWASTHVNNINDASDVSRPVQLCCCCAISCLYYTRSVRDGRVMGVRCSLLQCWLYFGYTVALAAGSARVTGLSSSIVYAALIRCERS